MRYYHGGAPGLRVGDVIEPRPDDDARHLVAGCPTCDARRAGTPLAADPNDPHAVYVCMDRDYASIYAHGYPRGALYRVEPLGEVTATADDPEDTGSFAVPGARVLAVLDPLVNLSAHDIRRLTRRYLGRVG